MRQAQRIEVGHEVARGGMGAVRTAHESATRRTVAMKVMLEPDSPEHGVRFISEARITARLEHPNIVPIYELGIDEHGQPFYTMKMVEGITLMRVLQLLKEGVAETVERYPLATLLTIFQKLCDALAFAHARGVIHRDLKPANIMLGKYGEVLVMDWGLAKILGTPDQQPSPDASTVEESPLRDPEFSEQETFNTHAGAILGTPQYMSPEQARGEIADLDVRSDIFVLGTILHEILTLERAFLGRNHTEIIARVAEYRGTPLPQPLGRLPIFPGAPCRSRWPRWCARPWRRTKRSVTPSWAISSATSRLIKTASPLARKTPVCAGSFACSSSATRASSAHWPRRGW